MRTKFYFLTILVLITAILSGCAGVAAAQSLNQTSESSAANLRTLNVNGTGKVYLTPDIAYVTIGVHTENKDAAQAVAENNAGSSKVKDALTGLGVELSDIQTQNFSIYPQQQYDANGRPTGEITYIVDNQIYVTVRDLAAIGDLLDTVVQAGANNIYGITFDVADRSKAQSEARKLAVADAQKQAEELAAAAGVSLGAIQSINTNVSSTVSVYEKGMGGGGAMPVAANVSVSPGQMLLQVDIYMVFEIR